MAIDNQTKINYFKEPLAGKTGYEAFRNNLTEILESHETEINNLETDKLEKNGYTGTAQDLKNGIDLKLDKGTYTGTAQDLKNDITDLKNQMKYYDTRALSIADEANISIGDYIETIGSISINDGLGGEYIVESTLTDTTGGWQIATGKYANRKIKNSKSYNAELTGIPTAPTGTAGSTTKQVATQEFVTNQDLGVGQTWQNVTSNRILGQTYTNTTGKPIIAYILTGGSSGRIIINGVDLQNGRNSVEYVLMSVIIQPGVTYSLAGSFQSWFELR